MERVSRLLWVLISFLCGTLFGTIIFVPRQYVLLCAALFIILGFSLSFKHSHKLWFCLWVAVLLFGVYRGGSVFRGSDISRLYGKQVEFYGDIVKEPVQTESMQQIVVLPEGMKSKILISLPKGISYSYGDKVAIKGKITEPKVYPDFNYEKYLQAQGISALAYRPQVLVLKSDQGNKLVHYLLSLKHWFKEKVYKLVGRPEADLLLGMLIGARSQLPSSVLELFQTVGMTHVLAVSGYNVSLLLVSVELLAPWVGRRFASVFGLCIIIFFVVIAGPSASVIRAAIMGSLLMLAWIFKRLYQLLPAILLTASIMVFLSPAILLWDVGFQLSFFATLGIVYGSPMLEPVAKRFLPKVLAQSVSVTFAAYIITLPLLALQFGTVSFIAPLANVLLLPLVPLCMLFGFLIALPFIGFGAAYFAKILTIFLLRGVDIFARVPFGLVQFHISHFQFFCMVGLLLVGYVLLVFRFKSHKYELFKE